MDLAQLIPQLLAGISQKIGVESKDLKLLVIANECDLDLKPIQQLALYVPELELEVKPSTIPSPTLSSSWKRTSCSRILVLAKTA